TFHELRKQFYNRNAISIFFSVGSFIENSIDSETMKNNCELCVLQRHTSHAKCIQLRTGHVRAGSNPAGLSAARVASKIALYTRPLSGGTAVFGLVTKPSASGTTGAFGAGHCATTSIGLVRATIEVAIVRMHAPNFMPARL